MEDPIVRCPCTNIFPCCDSVNRASLLQPCYIVHSYVHSYRSTKQVESIAATQSPAGRLVKSLASLPRSRTTRTAVPAKAGHVCGLRKSPYPGSSWRSRSRQPNRAVDGHLRCTTLHRPRRMVAERKAKWGEPRKEGFANRIIDPGGFLLTGHGPQGILNTVLASSVASGP